MALGQTILGYAIVVQLCRLLIQRCGVVISGRFAWRRVLLAGLVYGWLVEGVLTTTIVDDLPLSISWTGMAWHALLTVLLGWWLVPSLLRKPWRTSVVALSAIGAGVGAWAAFWRFEDASDPPLLEFALYLIGTTVVYAAGLGGWWTLHRVATPSRAGSLGSVLILTGLAVIHAIAAPVTLIGPVLIVLAVLALALSTPKEPVPPRRDALSNTARSLAKLSVVPVVGIVAYALLESTPVALPTGWAFLAIGVPVSIVLTLGALRPQTAGAWLRRESS